MTADLHRATIPAGPVPAAVAAAVAGLHGGEGFSMTTGVGPATSVWRPAAPRRLPSGWQAAVSRDSGGDRRIALRQLASTVGPVAALFALSALLAGTPGRGWATIPIGVLNGLFLVRLFGLFHDCAHGSLFPSRRANVVAGHLLGLVVATPLHEWARRHHLHHATSGNLARRGWWDFPLLTVREYAGSSRGARLAYRLSRHPALVFTVAPLLFFAVVQRFPAPGARRRHVANVLGVDLLLAAGALGLGRAGLLGTALEVSLVPAAVSSTIGFWFFYVQHQFPAAYWASPQDWTWTDAAFAGSALIDLPRWLRWFTVDLGYHHIHHLAPRIPNHRLAACHDANPEWPRPPIITLRSSRAALQAHLWDEERGAMVSFRDARALGDPRPAAAVGSP